MNIFHLISNKFLIFYIQKLVFFIKSIHCICFYFLITFYFLKWAISLILNIILTPIEILQQKWNKLRTYLIHILILTVTSIALTIILNYSWKYFIIFIFINIITVFIILIELAISFTFLTIFNALNWLPVRFLLFSHLQCFLLINALLLIE